ncbi:MAG: hypothetical protein AAGF12_36040 [Myxococcota bacterium]
MTILLRLWVPVSLLLLVGCGDDSSSTGDDGGAIDALMDGGEDGAGVDAPGFVVCSAGFSAGGFTGFIGVVDSFTEGTTTTAQAIDLGSTPLCGTAFGAAYVGIFESGTLTRYEPDGNGGLAPTGQVSFANEGISSFSGPSRSFVFLSETRALFVDRATAVVVVWNPTEMTVTSSFELEGLFTGGGRSSVRRVLAEGRDDILFYVRYVSDGLFTPESALVSLNPDTEEFTIDRDVRCGGLLSDFQTSDGAIYLASAAAVSTYEPLGIQTHTPCLLRVAPGATEFDDSFFVEMNTLTGGNLTGLLLPAGGDSALVLGFDPSVVDPSRFSEPNNYTNAQSWRPYLINDIKDPTPGTVLSSFPLQSGQVSELIFADGRPFLLRVASNFSSSTFQDISDVNAVVDGLTLTGAIALGGGSLTE